MSNINNMGIDWLGECVANYCKEYPPKGFDTWHEQVKLDWIGDNVCGDYEDWPPEYILDAAENLELQFRNTAMKVEAITNRKRDERERHASEEPESTAGVIARINFVYEEGEDVQQLHELAWLLVNSTRPKEEGND